jgi:hypothetical protein
VQEHAANLRLPFDVLSFRASYPFLLLARLSLIWGYASSQP